MTLHRVEVWVSFWEGGQNHNYEKRIYYIKARSRDLAERKAREIYLEKCLPNFVGTSFVEVIHPIKVV